MNKTKATKRALLMSMLSMLLCVAMLIGSTFAWFTDSVTSGRNQIVAGNLDVELEYAPKDAARTTEGAIEDTAWKTVESVTDLLGGALWEPGHTEYVYLRVRNNGSLALKYSLAANVYGSATGEPEKTYTNIEGHEFQLSKYLVFNVIDNTNKVEKREDLWISDSAEETAAMGKLDSLKADGEVLYPAKSEAGASEKAFTLAVYRPTTVGNVANWGGKDKNPGEEAPEIYFGFDLIATQTPYEEDSFDKNYDAALTVHREAHDIASLLDVLNNPSASGFQDDIVLDGEIRFGSGRDDVKELNISGDRDIVLEMGDNRIVINNGSSGKVNVTDGGKLTINADTPEEMPNDLTTSNREQAGQVKVDGAGSELTINGGYYYSSGHYSDDLFVGVIAASNGAELYVTGGSYSVTGYQRSLVSARSGAKATVTGGIFYGTSCQFYADGGEIVISGAITLQQRGIYFTAINGGKITITKEALENSKVYQQYKNNTTNEYDYLGTLSENKDSYKDFFDTENCQLIENEDGSITIQAK